MPYVVGLTGGIASGKSMIADLFARQGVPIIDADIVSRQIVQKGSPILTQIIEHFGSTILLENGKLNRNKLRQIIFQSETEKKWLNNLLHPAIRVEMLNQLSYHNTTYVLWVVPLLLENRLEQYCDRILVIDVSPQIQLERAIKRDRDRAEIIKNIIASQLNRQSRLQAADDIIENNLPFSENKMNIEQQVLKLHQFYQQQASNKK